MSLDFGRYMLGFEGIEYGYADGDQNWIFVESTCRAFDVETRQCGLFGTPERPAYCASYSGWKCGYRHWILTPDTSNVVRVDIDGFKDFADLFQFDRERRISAAPTVKDVRERLTAT